MLNVVLDTNVLLSAMRSRRGASAVILELWFAGEFQLSVSVPLALEYESILKRDASLIGMRSDEITDLVAFICANSNRVEHLVHRRPIVPDAADDFLAELAISCGCDYLVSHNVRHLVELREHGVKLVTPSQLLSIIRRQNE